MRYFLTTILCAMVVVSGLFISSATAGKTSSYQVYLVLWRGWEDAAQGFSDYFNTHQIPVNLVVRDADRDKSRLPGFVQEIKQARPDLVVTWGTSTALGILGPHDTDTPENYITDIPCVFMIVSQPVGVGLVPDFTSSGRNITGTRYLVPERTQINAARSYLPFDRIGVIFNPAEQNSIINVKALRTLAAEGLFELIEQPLPLDDAGDPVTGAIEGLVAELARFAPLLLYQGPDSFLNVHRDRLTGSALAHKIPVLAAGENPVRRSNALLGIINRYYSVGQLTAFKARQILVEKKSPETIPITSPKRFSYMINMRVAKQLKLYPPMNILKFAEVVE
jgi:putative tryptophan/tyrosine transport system substrate-binding protein